MPNRVRVKLIRKRKEGDGKSKMVCTVEIVDIGKKNFGKLLTEVTDAGASAAAEEEEEDDE